MITAGVPVLLVIAEAATTADESAFALVVVVVRVAICGTATVVVVDVVVDVEETRLLLVPVMGRGWKLAPPVKDVLLMLLLVATKGGGDIIIEGEDKDVAVVVDDTFGVEIVPVIEEDTIAPLLVMRIVFPCP